MLKACREIIFLWLQKLTPQHGLSRAIGFFANSRLQFIKTPLIDWFISKYNVNMDEAVCPNGEKYANFNDFFTRPLRANCRPICNEKNAISSPADGVISQLGNICDDKIFQAKGHNFNLSQLLATAEDSVLKQFKNGKFMTIYLSPKDYHRVHMPLPARLQSMTYVPGKLFSVNEVTTRRQGNLFANNERMVAIFQTQAGPMAMIMVGAMIVAAIETVWHGQVAPSKSGIQHWDYQTIGKNIYLDQGQEMGRFKLGSTVILLFAKDTAQWLSSLDADSPLLMGQAIGQTLPTTAVDYAAATNTLTN